MNLNLNFEFVYKMVQKRVGTTSFMRNLKDASRLSTFSFKKFKDASRLGTFRIMGV